MQVWCWCGTRFSCLRVAIDSQRREREEALLFAQHLENISTTLCVLYQCRPQPEPCPEADGTLMVGELNVEKWWMILHNTPSHAQHTTWKSKNRFFFVMSCLYFICFASHLTHNTLVATTKNPIVHDTIHTTINIYIYIYSLDFKVKTIIAFAVLHKIQRKYWFRDYWNQCNCDL